MPWVARPSTYMVFTGPCLPFSKDLSYLHTPVLYHIFNSLRPRRSRCYFANYIFKYSFLNKNALISIKISLKFIPNGPINNIPASVQIMAWCRPGAKPLSETMMVSLHIYESLSLNELIHDIECGHRNNTACRELMIRVVDILWYFWWGRYEVTLCVGPCVLEYGLARGIVFGSQQREYLASISLPSKQPTTCWKLPTQRPLTTD